MVDVAAPLFILMTTSVLGDKVLVIFRFAVRSSRAFISSALVGRIESASIERTSVEFEVCGFGGRRRDFFEQSF